MCGVGKCDLLRGLHGRCLPVRNVAVQSLIVPQAQSAAGTRQTSNHPYSAFLTRLCPPHTCCAGVAAPSRFQHGRPRGRDRPSKAHPNSPAGNYRGAAGVRASGAQPGRPDAGVGCGTYGTRSVHKGF
eukprot:359013-Chlamydomonas_euryale.AAC.5